MAFYKADIANVELNTGKIYRAFIGNTIGKGDNKANRFGVRLFRDGEPVSAESATVTGLFVAPDGTRYVISETSYPGSTGAEGNVAYVQLPGICYAVDGQFTLAIKLTGGGVEGTMRIIDGVVSETGENGAVVPTSTIPTTEDIIAAYEEAVAVMGGSVRFDASQTLSDAEAETARGNIKAAGIGQVVRVDEDQSLTSAQKTTARGNIEAAGTEDIAPAFSTSTAYAIGQYVTYNGGLYRFIADHAAGAWDENDAKLVTVGDCFDVTTSGMEESTGLRQIQLIKGKYIGLQSTSVPMSNGIPVYSGNSNGYDVGIMPCVAGDVFTINGHGGGSTRLWAFVNSSGTILSVSASGVTENNLILQAPEGSAWIIIHTNDNRASFKGVNYAPMNKYRSVDVLSFLKRANATGSGINFIWNGNVCTVDGKKTDGNAANYICQYTDEFPPVQIVPGGKYIVHFEQGGEGSVGLRFVWLLSDSSKIYELYYKDDEVEAPENFVGVSIMLFVAQNVEVDNEVIECQLFTVSPDTRYIDEKVDKLMDGMASYLPRNILPEFGNFITHTNNGIMYTWDTDKIHGTLDGIATGTSYHFFFSYNNGVPEQIKPGEKYDVEIESSLESGVVFRLYFLHVDDSVTSESFASNGTVTIPVDCIGISVTIVVIEGTVCDDDTVTVEFKTTSTLEVQGGVANHVAQMFSIGSSFLTGMIYPHGVLSHICSFDNSPYGNIAIGLGIEQNNVHHTLLGGTGLLYDNGKGSILSRLLQTDLSEYDYVLTQFNRPDLGTGSNQGFPLGDLNSTAGDGSIVGAVLQLLAYMKDQNPTATLILVGAPPSDQREAYARQNVFTAKYNNGVSIGEADLMMHRLAVREHFIFIDWEDLNESYYYLDLTYGTNVHPEDDNVCRTMGLYLARQCNYTTSMVKVMRADLNG